MPVTFVSLPHGLTLILQIIGFSLMSTRKFTLLLKISLAVETFHSLIQCFFLFSFWMLLFLWKNNDIMTLIGILLNLWVILEKNRDFKNIIQTVHEHGMCMISLFLNGPFDILKFPMWRSSTSCFKFILRHYILFDIIWWMFL